MRFFGPVLRPWLVVWLALALPLAGYAHPAGVSCGMACAQVMKGCHACCDHTPGCGLAAKAIPAAPAKAVSASAAAPDAPLPAASVALLQPLPLLLPPASGQARDQGPPRVIIDVQAAHCARLL